MPHVDPQCVTHHLACACREERFKKMRELLVKVEKWGLSEPHDPAMDVEKAKLYGEMKEVLSEG